MIAAFDHKKLRGQASLFDYGPNLFCPSKGIAGTLNKEHRRANVLQVLIAQLIRPTRRMQRVSQKDQTINIVGSNGRNLRSYPSAHRLAANHQQILLQLKMPQRCLDYRLITGFKPRFWIREAAPLLFIQKVESQDI